MNTRALTWMTVVGLAAASVPASQAGDREWATAGKILTGVAVGSVLTRAFCEPQPVVYAPPPTTVVYAQPAPVVVSQPVLAPAVTYAQPVAPAPVVVAPAPVQTITYVQAAPTVVYTQPAVVYAAPPPPVVIYRRPPMICEPLISVRIGGGYHSHRHGRW